MGEEQHPIMRHLMGELVCMEGGPTTYAIPLYNMHGNGVRGSIEMNQDGDPGAGWRRH